MAPTLVPPFDYLLRFIRAKDGDTVVGQIDPPPYPLLRTIFDLDIRLTATATGVQAPEEGDPGYYEAKAFTHLWCAERAGRLILSIVKTRPDRYGRAVGRIGCTLHHTDGSRTVEDLGQALLDTGHAIPIPIPR